MRARLRYAIPVGLAAIGLVLSLAGFRLAGGSGSNKAYLAAIAADGPALTATPTPTPVPGPKPTSQCYQPRGLGTRGFDLLPADGDSVLLNCQVVAYYGYPGLPGLGVLGEEEPAATAARIKAVAASYDAVNGPRTVVAAFHVLFAVAQASSTADGSWLVRIPPELLAPWLAEADRQDMLVILDDQVGHSTVDAEMAYLLPYLDNPRVHLALDPEWSMPPGVAPGTIIGGMDASAINRAQELMSDYIAAHGLANRMLIVHQFVPEMIRDKAELRSYPNVDLVIDTDGFGYPRQKLDNYARYIAADGAPHGGMKLFYTQDIDMMSPDQVAALSPQPDLIIYQ
jgi:hypothetical protein